MQTNIEYLLGGFKRMQFVDAAVTERSFRFLYVAEACVLTTLNEEGPTEAGTSILSDAGLTGKTIPAGVIIHGRNDKKIVSVTPTSGKLIGYE